MIKQHEILDIVEGGWIELNTMVEMYIDICAQIYNQSGGESWSNVAYLATALNELETTINMRLKQYESNDADDMFKTCETINDIPRVQEVHNLWQ